MHVPSQALHMKVVYRTCFLTRLIYRAGGIGWHVSMSLQQNVPRCNLIARRTSAHRSANPDAGAHSCRQKVR